MTAPVPACDITGIGGGDHRGPVVVIDVIRAFTAAATAFQQGAVRIHCVESLERARELASEVDGALLMGEERGLQPDGFDFGNSPSQLAAADLTGATLVQRTSNGTRGLADATGSVVLAAAATNATATATYVAAHLATVAPAASAAPGDRAGVRLVCTGETPTEDHACALYIRGRLIGAPVALAHLAEQVLAAGVEHVAAWAHRGDDDRLAAFADDVRRCADVDRHAFAMVGERHGDVITLHRVDVER